MRVKPNKDLLPGVLRWGLLTGICLALLACPTDSPTAPQQDPTSPDHTPSDVWVVTITSDVGSIETNGSPATLTITIRRAGTNELPPDGATSAVSTTLGRFEDPVTGPTEGVVQLKGGVAQLRLFPGPVPGEAPVQAQIEASVGSLLLPVDEGVAQEFFVTGVSPSEGDTAGGETVDIMGQGFAETVRVFFGSIPAEVISVASELIRVISPPGSEGFVDVSVTTRFGTEAQENFTFSSGFRYTDENRLPMIFSVDPPSGPTRGGTRVKINGDNFSPPLQVFFGTLEATEILGASSMQVVARTPASEGRVIGPVPVRVINISTGAEAVLPGGFRYVEEEMAITSINPVSGPFTGGTPLNIFGFGFEPPLFVDIDTKEGLERQLITSIADDGTRISVRTDGIPVSSCTDVPGDVIVTLRNSGQADTGPGFTFLVEEFGPRITSIAPTEIAFDHTGTITVKGSSLRNVEAKIGGASVPVIPVSGKEIKLDPPIFGDKFFDTQDCPAGSARSEILLPTNTDISVRNPDSKCEEAFTLGLTVLPDTGKDECSDP